LQKAAKRKKIHAFKSKARLEQMELTQNKRQNAWHQFQTAKGKNKKVGTNQFFSKQPLSRKIDFLPVFPFPINLYDLLRYSGLLGYFLMMQNMLLVFAGGIFYRTQEREHFQVSR
jgi:hypothetical protein